MRTGGPVPWPMCPGSALEHVTLCDHYLSVPWTMMAHRRWALCLPFALEPFLRVVGNGNQLKYSQSVSSERFRSLAEAIRRGCMFFGCLLEIGVELAVW